MAKFVLFCRACQKEAELTDEDFALIRKGEVPEVMTCDCGHLKGLATYCTDYLLKCQGDKDASDVP